MVGRVILGAMGLPATNLPTTKNMGQWLAALGFQPGIGGPGSISVGWYDHGPNPNDGHAAMTLSNGENAEAGGSHGNFVIGAGAAGAASSQFDHHMFLPTLYGEGAATGMPGFAAGMGAGGFGGMGGGIPPGATPGTGPGGQPGYYTANPQRVAAAEERLRHLDAEIDNAEKRRSELKATAKQSERDRLDEEIRHLKAERTRSSSDWPRPSAARSTRCTATAAPAAARTHSCRCRWPTNSGCPRGCPGSRSGPSGSSKTWCWGRWRPRRGPRSAKPHP